MSTGGYSAAPSNTILQMATTPPLERTRLTAAIRILMVIPQIVVLIFVGLAALVVVIIGWFSVLFTGSLPPFARDFLSGVLRWTTRFNSYLYLLTDDYPPFSLEREDQYPTVIEIPPPVRLNQLAVLLRLFIAIPALVVSSVANSGLGVVSIASWFMVVFTGRLPDPLYSATRVVIRYQARAAAYYTMLTPEYPWGLFGDGPMTTSSASDVTPGVRDSWTMRLNSSARTTVIVILVIGVIVGAIRH